MFKKFQQGGMMPPQPQGQMLPPQTEQMAPQPQGGGQLPPEVMQILMTLPENIRQYLLSLPPDQMMMELQKIMQEQMAQQQGQGQQGPPMPPQGGEQMAPPMMGKYGMKMKAGTGNGKLTTNPYEDALVDKRNKGIITLRNDPNGNIQDESFITTKPKVTTSTVANTVQSTVNPNQNLNIPQGNYSSVTPSEKRATQFSKDMDMMIDGYKVKLIDNNGTLGYIDPVKNVFVKLNIGQTVKAPQGANIVNSVNNSQAVISEPKVVSRNLTTTPSTVIAKSAAPKVVTTKPAQTNSSPTTKQQGITANPTKKATPDAKSKVTATPNNAQASPSIVSSTTNNNQDIIIPFLPKNSGNQSFNSPQHTLREELNTINKKLEDIKYNNDQLRKEGVSSPNREATGLINRKKQLESLLNSRYNNVERINELERELKDLTNKREQSISTQKQRKTPRGVINSYNTNNSNYEQYQRIYQIERELDKLKNAQKSYKSGGQLPSALKVSTPLKTIMDRKIEMFKSGGKMKLKTCKHGC